MADEEQLAILRQGSGAWNAWRQKHPGGLWPDLSGAELGRANLSGAQLGDAILSGANLSGANLRGTKLGRADLSGADLSSANLSGATLSGAELVDADLTGADLSGAELVRTELGGAKLSGANLSRTQLSEAELGRAKLSGANLSEAYLRRAELRDADLSGADLSWARLYGANLSGANLTRANLTGVSLCDAHLIGANLGGAHLYGAELRDVDLSEANLSEAQLYETILADLDLSSCKGLDSCEHHGPSTIDHRTLQRSGQLPLAFLRGVGLPDALIKQLPRLLGPAQFHDCFISHSSQDSEFIGQLYNDLRERGVLCWYAPQDMKAGSRILDTVHKAIAEHDKVLLILSAASIASEWVEREVKRALAEERSSGRDILVPICIDDAIFTTGEAWAVTLRDDRRIADFRPKAPDAYLKNLDRLRDDLKVEADGQPPAR